jgi:DNA-binding response OmpR family regulator
MTPSAPGRSESRILIVDDERDTCANLQDILGEFGFTVDTADDPLAALAMVQEQAYDVALLDLRMPGLDGIELCRRIRERWAGTVRMIVTAYADPAATAAAANAGAYRVLTKPVDVRLLIGLINAVLEQPLVLVVDDDHDLCKSLEDVLVQAGFRCGVTHSASELVRQIGGPVPQVFLVDLRLADEDGLSLLNSIRQRHPESRTILITAHHDEIASRMGEAEAFGATVCLKPFETRELIERIRGTLPDASSSAP